MAPPESVLVLRALAAGGAAACAWACWARSAAADDPTDFAVEGRAPQLAALEPPYTAVIFSSLRTLDDGGHDYAAAADEMARLAVEQPGYLGVESAREGPRGFGLTVSYWADEVAAARWKEVAAHSVAQRLGREAWYEYYTTRVATVHREYSFPAREQAARGPVADEGRAAKKKRAQRPPRAAAAAQGPRAQRAEALQRFHAANVPDDWKRSGLSQPQLERHARRWLVPVAVGILNLTSDWNVGAVMRTAALLRFCRFVILGRNKFDTRGAVGAHRYIEVQRRPAMAGELPDVAAIRALLNQEGFTPVFVAGRGGGRGDTRGAAAGAGSGGWAGGGVLLGDLDWGLAHAALPEGRRFLLLMGNEGVGIPEQVLALRHEFEGAFIVSVEQWGMMRSMNVAVAAGIVMHHCASWHVQRLAT